MSDRKKYDVTALGELLIDFTENGRSGQGNPIFEANPGGAPCNVLAMAAKLGYHTAFIGKVGKDCFGEQLRETLKETGIGTEYLLTDEEVHTTLAIVHTLPDGDRDFSFYRNPGADMMLAEKEIPEEVIRSSRIFHFGTLSMTHTGVRAATKKAVTTAREAGCIVSFDPNLRPTLWSSLKEAREQALWGIEHCHILKISDDELTWLTEKEDLTEGAKWIQSRYRVPLIFVTMGKKGSRVYFKKNQVEAASFVRKDTIDTTGAGDTFWGCILAGILEKKMEMLAKEELEEMLTFANSAASIITARKGALRVMPSRTEIQKNMESAEKRKSRSF